MQTVQKSFKIPAYGIRHTNPNIAAETALLADKLEKEKIQIYVKNRPGNEFIPPARNLIHHGANYANTSKAFHAFRDDPRRAENLGVVIDEPENKGAQSVNEAGTPGEAEANEEGGDDGDETAEQYLFDGPTEDDLEVDGEGYLDIRDMLLAQGGTMADDLEAMMTGDHDGPANDDSGGDDADRSIL